MIRKYRHFSCTLCREIQFVTALPNFKGTRTELSLTFITHKLLGQKFSNFECKLLRFFYGKPQFWELDCLMSAKHWKYCNMVAKWTFSWHLLYESVFVCFPFPNILGWYPSIDLRQRIIIWTFVVLLKSLRSLAWEKNWIDFSVIDYLYCDNGWPKSSITLFTIHDFSRMYNL